MKKIIVIFLMLVMCFTVSGCNCTDCDGCYGNKTTFDFTKTYEEAYVKIKDEWVHVRVSQWNDYEGEQIQLLLYDGTVILTSIHNCILYSGELPEVE